MKYLAVKACCLALIASVSATIPRPRGVPKSLASHYQVDATNTFQCLDGSATVPFDYVNDDYCDCRDGSDEPGTSACINGKFHCTNAGYKPEFFPASYVNDGVCDCCDGTDEYMGIIDCVNDCKEKGKKYLEQVQRIKQLQEDGFKKWKEFADEGKKQREEKKTKLQQLQEERIGIEATQKEMETKKNEAETPEKEAKDKHQKAWDEEKARREGEREIEKAKEAFTELDTNNDGFVDILEMVIHSEFDIDSNGDVSEEEAKEYLEDKEKVDLDTFTANTWPNIKQIFKKLVPQDTTKEGEESEKPSEETQGETAAPPGEAPSESEKEEEEKMPEYDEETKQLITAADEARRQFNEADEKLKQLDRDISSLQGYLNLDLGPDDEFAVLKDNCYEYTDREYTYKLCPFDRASQRPKNGGAETSLGTWGKWNGPDDDKYSKQIYERGQNCWNGPDRSVTIHFHCGMDHQVTNAYEPSRCEYAFDFTTPSSCSKPPKAEVHEHDEL